MIASFAIEDRRRVKESSSQPKTIGFGIEKHRFDAAAVHHVETDRLKPENEAPQSRKNSDGGWCRMN